MTEAAAATRATAARWAAVLCAAALLAAAGLWLGADRAGAGARHCAPVVSRVGPGLTKAKVLILNGRVDCLQSRKVVYRALSKKRYKKRRVAGWTCTSTRHGRSGVFGARCATEGYAGREVIRSTVPQRCPDCHGTRP